MSLNTQKENVQHALPQKSNRLLRDAEVQNLTGIRKTRRAEMMRDGKFPQPIKICGGRTNYWLASEIDQFIATFRLMRKQRRNTFKKTRSATTGRFHW